MKKLNTELKTSHFTLGTWSQCASPEILEIIGYSNFDFTIIDTEHGYFGLETAENLVRAAEAAQIMPIVRVPVNEPHMIMKALDIGAQGVIVPQITSREGAQKAISAARYYPDGTRGACPCVRAGQHHVREWDHFARRSNIESTVILLIEGPEGMTNVREIVSTEGLDAVMIGPFDLSVSLGVGGQLDHEKVTSFFLNVIGMCRDAGVELIIPNFDLDQEKARIAIERWRALGCKHFTVGTDKLLFANYMKQFGGHVRPMPAQT
ncbi:HpcH/HpaI aldolase family protein [Noviherbaspirillum pedocola]|uniref:Aldolase n=1 Tax=Noviherbaspirillum pedocola TaxID=2801341 RepID=A0A934T0L0_9BURK|nr:aldolase/citrate lyase family protein [Noviherbaspirillum pedocola]MBK4739252.1 aldolase [Noviherbaspirillum pedocola]